MRSVVAAATPPDVGEATAEVIDPALSSMMSALGDLAVWLIPMGVVLLVVAMSLRSFSRMEPMSFGPAYDDFDERDYEYVPTPRGQTDWHWSTSDDRGPVRYGELVTKRGRRVSKRREVRGAA